MKYGTLGAVVLTLAGIVGCRAPNYFTLRQDLQYMTQAQFKTQRDKLEKRAKNEFLHAMAVIADEPSHNEAYFKEQLQKTVGATLHERLNKVYNALSKEQDYTSDRVEAVLHYLQETDALRKKYAAEPEPVEPEAPEEPAVPLDTGQDTEPETPELAPVEPVQPLDVRPLTGRARFAQRRLQIYTSQYPQAMLAAYERYPARDHEHSEDKCKKKFDEYRGARQNQPVSRVAKTLRHLIAAHVRDKHGESNPEFPGLDTVIGNIEAQEQILKEYRNKGGR